MGTAESSLIQQANEISSMVRTTDFNLLTGRVVTAESTIIQHADAINQQAHVYAALRSPGHGLAKGCGYLTCIEYVTAQKNMIFGILNGRYHGRIGLIAVVQKAYAVAAAEVLFGKHTANMLHAGNAVGYVFWRNF